MMISCACALSSNCSNRSFTKGGRVANCFSYSCLNSSDFIGRSSKGGLGLGCTSQSTAECNARLFQRGRV